MKTIIKTSVIVGITMILGLAQVGAQAGENSLARPERPEKAEKENERPSLTQVKDAVKSFQDQKKEFIKSQVELAKTGSGEARDAARGNAKDASAQLRQESKEAVQAAKRQAMEQARKLAEEAKEAAKEEHRRGKD